MEVVFHHQFIPSGSVCSQAWDLAMPPTLLFGSVTLDLLKINFGKLEIGGIGTRLA